MLWTPTATACLTAVALMAGLAEPAFAQQVAAPPATAEPAAKQPDMPRDYAAIIRPNLPAGWRCTYDFDTLVIARDEEVALLGRISMPPIQNREELIRQFGIRSPYLIVLTFTPRLSEAEHRGRIADRDKALAAVHAKFADPRLGKHAYGAGMLEAAKYRIPQFYNYRFSIHLHSTAMVVSHVEQWNNFDLAAPESAIKERDAIVRLLLDNMTAYPLPQAGAKSSQ